MESVTSIGRRPATVGGCPGEFDTQRYLCSFSVSVSPKDASLTLIATSDGAELPSRVVELRAFNYCARDLAYVELRLDRDPAEWSATQFLNPCASF